MNKPFCLLHSSFGCFWHCPCFGIPSAIGNHLPMFFLVASIQCQLSFSGGDCTVWPKPLLPLLLTAQAFYRWQLFVILAVAAMAVPTVPDLEGLATDWERCSEVREFVRVNNCLFSPAVRCVTAECNVACAEQNYYQLSPIARRVLMPDMSVGQVTVPGVAKQTFSSNFIIYIFCFAMFCL